MIDRIINRKFLQIKAGQLSLVIQADLEAEWQDSSLVYSESVAHSTFLECAIDLIGLIGLIADTGQWKQAAMMIQLDPDLLLFQYLLYLCITLQFMSRPLQYWHVAYQSAVFGTGLAFRQTGLAIREHLK